MFGKNEHSLAKGIIMSLNHWSGIGRLRDDPESFETSSGDPVSRFILVCDREFKNSRGERESDSIPVSVYGKDAEFVVKHLQAGRSVVVPGRLKIHYNRHKNTYFAEISSNYVEALERPKGNNHDAEAEA